MRLQSKGVPDAMHYGSCLRSHRRRSAVVHRGAARRKGHPSGSPRSDCAKCTAAAAQTPTLAAISLLQSPLAAARIIRARSANDCGAPCFRVNAISSPLSVSWSTIATARPLKTDERPMVVSWVLRRGQRDYMLGRARLGALYFLAIAKMKGTE
jgi:hypothetical protein